MPSFLYGIRTKWKKHDMYCTIFFLEEAMISLISLLYHYICSCEMLLPKPLFGPDQMTILRLGHAVASSFNGSRALFSVEVTMFPECAQSKEYVQKLSAVYSRLLVQRSQFVIAARHETFMMWGYHCESSMPPFYF